MGIASVSLTGLDVTSGSLLVPRFTRVLCSGCLPLWAGVCYSRRNWSLLKKPQEFGPFWNLDRWEVSLQDQQLVAADLVGKASRNMGTSTSATRLVGDQTLECRVHGARGNRQAEVLNTSKAGFRPLHKRFPPIGTEPGRRVRSPH